MNSPINVLCLGDIVGKPGREVLKARLSKIQAENDIHFTIVNIENAAAGFGLTKKVYNDIAHLDIQVFTSGNHIFDKKELVDDLHQLPNVIRPINYSDTAPGKGAILVEHGDYKVAVVNAIGRVFMNTYDSPFKAMSTILPALKEETSVIIVDFHGEATSEKQAMGYYLDGKVSAVYGTHTHVQTADNRILEKGTGYMTDIGMTGHKNSILGMKKEPIIQKFLDNMPARFETHKNGLAMTTGVVFSIDQKSGKTIATKRIYEEVEI